ncbi:MAG: flippase [Phycisphaerae bacterium]|nr:flippase [Saprospiraceae bacterium]
MEKSANASPHNYWLRSGLLSLSEKMAAMAFNLGTAMLLLRLLTKEAFAAWGIFILVTYFVEMGRSGLLQNGLVRALATRRDNATEQANIITAALFLNITYSILSNLIIWLCADWICQQYQVPLLAEMLPVYFLTNFLMAFCTHSNFVQQANFEFRGVFWTSVFYRGIPSAWVFWCWTVGNTVILWQFSVAVFAGVFLAALAAWWYARPYLFLAKRLDLKWFMNLASYGKFVLGTNLSTMFYKNIDKLALGQMLGPAAFAVYDAAGRVTQLVEAPAFSIAAVVFPKSAEKMALEGHAGVKKMYERSVGATLAVILPFVVFVLVFAEPIIRIFAGSQYMESANVLRLTAFFGLFMPFAVQFGTVLDSTGKPGVNLAYTFFTALLNLALSYLLIQKFGLFGAAYATLVGYALSFILMQNYLLKEFKINALRAFLHLPEFYRMGWEMLKKRSLK